MKRMTWIDDGYTHVIRRKLLEALAGKIPGCSETDVDDVLQALGLDLDNEVTDEDLRDLISDRPDLVGDSWADVDEIARAFGSDAGADDLDQLKRELVAYAAIRELLPEGDMADPAAWIGPRLAAWEIVEDSVRKIAEDGDPDPFVLEPEILGETPPKELARRVGRALRHWGTVAKPFRELFEDARVARALLEERRKKTPDAPPPASVTGRKK